MVFPTNYQLGVSTVLADVPEFSAVLSECGTKTIIEIKKDAQWFRLTEVMNTVFARCLYISD